MLWIRSFLGEILEEIRCGRIFQDNNTSTISMVFHESVSERSKNIDVKFHFIMKLKSSGEAEFPHVNSPEMCADIFTMDLSDDIYPRHASVMREFILDA